MSVPSNAFPLTPSPFPGTTLSSVLQTRSLFNPTASLKQPLPVPTAATRPREQSTYQPGRRSASCDMSPSQLARYCYPQTTKTPDLVIATSPDCKKPIKRKGTCRPFTGSFLSQTLRKHRGESQYKGKFKEALSLDLQWTKPSISSPSCLVPSQRFGIRGHTSTFQPRKAFFQPSKPIPVHVQTFLPSLPFPSSPPS